MTTNEPRENDNALRRLLKEWRTDMPLPPGFQEAVWRRIESARASASPSVRAVIAHWIGTLLLRPALVLSLGALLFVIGVTAGWTQSREETARIKGDLSQRYVRVLDPYLTPRQ